MTELREILVIKQKHTRRRHVFNDLARTLQCYFQHIITEEKLAEDQHPKVYVMSLSHKSRY